MTATAPAALSLRDLSVEHAGSLALERIDLAILPGELFVVLGTSGAGKSTLLRAISGLDRMRRGEILVDDRDVTRQPVQRRDIALLQQDFPLWPSYTALRNVTLALRQAGLDRKTRSARAAAMLGKLGLGELQAHLPGQLTPGQRQRVALARTLAREAAVTLLDEPFSAQGVQLRNQLITLLRHHHRHRASTTVIATQDPVQAMRLADRIVMLVEGRVVQIGTPQTLYDTPVSRQIAEYLGPVNLLEGEVEHAGDQPLFRSSNGLVVPLFDHRLKRARRGWAMFRPHQVRPINAEGPLVSGLIRVHGFVTEVEFSGDVIYYTTDIDGTQVRGVLARDAATPAPEIGDRLVLGIDPTKVQVLER